MEEMMEDTMESLEPEDLDEDIQTEVDKVLSELTADKNAAKVKPGMEKQGSIRLPEVPGATVRDEEPVEEEEVEEDLAEMQSRLQALRS